MKSNWLILCIAAIGLVGCGKKQEPAKPAGVLYIASKPTVPTEDKKEIEPILCFTTDIAKNRQDGDNGCDPEPIDVPAIQEKRPVVQYHTDCPPLPDGTHGPKGDLCYIEPVFETHWTCREKSRIKLTAEDGKVWCHKPQVQP